MSRGEGQKRIGPRARAKRLGQWPNNSAPWGAVEYDDGELIRRLTVSSDCEGKSQFLNAWGNSASCAPASEDQAFQRRKGNGDPIWGKLDSGIAM